MTAPVPVTPTEAREAMARALWAKHSGGMSWGAVQSDLRDYFLGLADAALAALPAEPAADARLAADSLSLRGVAAHAESLRNAPGCTPYCDGPCSDPCAALPPAQPDPATVERARAEGREQARHALREAAEALKEARAYIAHEAPHGPTDREMRRVIALVARALSSATPSAPEGTP